MQPGQDFSGHNAWLGSGAGSLRLGAGVVEQGCRGGKKPGGNVTEMLVQIHTGVTWVEGRLLEREVKAPPTMQAQWWKLERLPLGCRGFVVCPVLTHLLGH